MNKWKKNLFFIFYFLAGILIGSLIASATKNSAYLNWLSYGGTIGFASNQPAIIDLIIFKLQFGFSFTINIAQIITTSLTLWIYGRSRWC